MKTGRLEAFSDGVLAIIITIMVLEMKVPQGTDMYALLPVLPVFLTYLGSFIYLGIYWNNHHHLLQATNKVNGSILWANLNLLFWLSLFPFVTGWMGENHFQQNPVALYGIVLLLAAIAYKILSHYVIKSEGRESVIGKVLQNNKKEYVSMALYASGVVLAFVEPIISVAIYIFMAIYWIIPDRRIEKELK
ncbi:TMEM175 family protein [Arenibacter amylolyticus]|uniref:TMEM175 family protein n=1 Tax=Arenibacter amylolyticus TaxID=1406873 RepID=UPI000A378686|nr:TMEM175 family protein [Arenibacter amylolyticus]